MPLRRPCVRRARKSNGRGADRRATDTWKGSAAVLSAIACPPACEEPSGAAPRSGSGSVEGADALSRRGRQWPHRATGRSELYRRARERVEAASRPAASLGMAARERAATGTEDTTGNHSMRAVRAVWRLNASWFAQRARGGTRFAKHKAHHALPVAQGRVRRCLAVLSSHASGHYRPREPAACNAVCAVARCWCGESLQEPSL